MICNIERVSRSRDLDLGFLQYVKSLAWDVMERVLVVDLDLDLHVGILPVGIPRSTGRSTHTHVPAVHGGRTNKKSLDLDRFTGDKCKSITVCQWQQTSAAVCNFRSFGRRPAPTKDLPVRPYM